MVLEANGAAIDVGCATEGVQLHFVLGCGAHLRYCTPHAVNSPTDLICRHCASEKELEAARLQRPSEWERDVFKALCSSGLGAGLRPEARLELWHGRIDFLHHPSGVLIQVDGEGHFQSRVHNAPKSQLLERDWEMCRAAWENGRALVRLHYRDIAAGATARIVSSAVAAASARGKQPLLVLSPGFNLPPQSKDKSNYKQTSMLARLANLQHASMRSDADRMIWIQPIEPAP